MDCAADKFWGEDITQLICSIDVIPREGASLNQKLNAITRLAILLSIAIACFEPVIGISTLTIAIIVILALFYIHEEGPPPHEPYAEVYVPPTTQRFCRDSVPLTPNDPDYISPNQLLVGGPNPKTRVPPLIAPRSHDLTQWRENDLVEHSAINDQSNFDVYRSGYDCGVLPTKCVECLYVPCMCPECKKCNTKPCTCTRRPVKEHFTENFHLDFPHENTVEHSGVAPIPTLPPLKPVTCVDPPHRDSLLTQTLQPGVYQKSHVGEPINSNIGISYTQQFAPTEVDETSNSIKYTQMDPSTVTVIPTLEEREIDQTVYNTYDPRFTGYGTSYRSYIEPVTGQPRFFYDDVDAITMPNYITRSNVDVFPWASKYGPDVSHSDTYSEHRQLANNAFTDSSVTFRTEMQERLMRKRNAELWQQRAMPKSLQPRNSGKSCL